VRGDPALADGVSGAHLPARGCAGILTFLMDPDEALNISIEKHFRDAAAAHVPRHRFDGTRDFARWKAELLPQVIALLGAAPPRVPLNPRLIGERCEDGLIKQRIVLDVEPGLSAPALVYRPEKSSGKLAAILCCHGHGPFGKDAVMGARGGDRELEANIRLHNYDYGLKMARAGFVTMAIDWRGFGERDDRRAPNPIDVVGPARDMCNVHFLRSMILGRTLLGENVHDGRRALDYLASLDFVDGGRIGAIGLSFGGTMTMWLALTDERIGAADIICYSDRFAEFAMRRGNFCGSQVTPGLFQLCDLPDLQGLIAPRPLLIEIGKLDDCFFDDSAMSCYREVEKIYAAAGARENLALVHIEGGHEWGGNHSVAFFRRFLG
jgi:dienelactone hydrolase